MSKEKYKKYILEMIDRIEDEKAIERIYNYIHRFFYTNRYKIIVYDWTI